MSLKKVLEPYELLVRWKEGKISGAHVGFIQRILEDGKEISHSIQDVQPAHRETGFPLDDFLQKLHVDLLSALEESNRKNKELSKQIFGLMQRAGLLEEALKKASLEKGSVPLK